MPAERFVITSAYEPPELDLWGHVFVLRPLTKDVETKLNGQDAALDAMFENAEKFEDVVSATGAYFDVMLTPLEHPPEAKNSKPSTLLKKNWDNGQLSVEALTQLFLFVRGRLQAPPT